MPRFWDLFSKAKAERVSEERRLHLERAHQELEILYNKVRELDKLKTEFFSNVSRELRTPLHLVLGPVKTLLSESGLTPKQREALGVVERNARTLLKHVNDLLDIAKLEAGQMVVDYAEIDLAQLLRQTASHFDLLAHERHITLSVDSPDSVPAQVDPAKVHRAWTGDRPAVRRVAWRRDSRRRLGSRRSLIRHSASVARPPGISRPLRTFEGHR